MKKIFMGVAVVSLIMASCANEELVGTNNNGKMFELKVSQGLESRTTLKFDAENKIYQTLWSEGDQIYVTSEDGKTEGVLTLDSEYAGSTVGTFRGYVFGDGELTKAVFPVPSNKVVSLSKRSADETDAPMVGTISGQSTTLVNQAAIIKLNIIDLPENSTLTISGDNIIPSATWNGSTLVNGNAGNIVITGADALDNIYIPVFVKNDATTTTLSVKVGNGDALTLTDIAIEKEKISVNVPVLVYSNGTLVEATNEGDNVQVVTPGEYAIQTLNNFAKTENAVIWVEAGEYAPFRLTDVAKGVTIICEEGTVFKGWSKLNINGATIVGATFVCDWENESYTVVDQTINGVFKNCVFDSWDALRWCEAGETVEFEDCVFKGGSYAVHFNGGVNDITFRRCTLSGFNAFGAAVTMLTFEDCKFIHDTTGLWESEDNGANLWGSTRLIACEFTFDGSAAYEWIDCIGADKTYEFENCTINGVAYTPENYKDYDEKIYSRNNVTVKINGVDCQM